MKGSELDPFVVVAVDEDDEVERAPHAAATAASPAMPAAVTARFDGFDLEDRPLLSSVPGLPGEVAVARTTVPLTRAQRGQAVVVVFENGDRRCPIVIGVLQPSSSPVATEANTVSAQADETRLVLSAEREVVLRCGDASITLTRAGKVLIKGAYVLSRSSGYNRIKGAAVDIN